MWRNIFYAKIYILPQKFPNLLPSKVTYPSHKFSWFTIINFYPSLVPRTGPSLAPVCDHLQYNKTWGQGRSGNGATLFPGPTHLEWSSSLSSPVFPLTVPSFSPHTPGVFVTLFMMAYLISPRFCHRFVGYLEEEAVKTYTLCLEVRWSIVDLQP